MAKIKALEMCNDFKRVRHSIYECRTFRDNYRD